MARVATTVGALTLTAVAALAAVVVPAGSHPPRAQAGGKQFVISHWTDPKGSSHVVRWDPCQTITYAVNARKAGSTPRARAAAVSDVQDAMVRAANRTGMSFRYVGTTRQVPRDAGGQSWADRQTAAEIVVAWVKPGSATYGSNLLTQVSGGYASGTGGWAWRAWQSGSGQWRLAIGRGFVVINASQNGSFRPGFGSGTTRGALLLHEIGHAVGLNHVGSTDELMYPTMLRRAASTYKFGDKRGLSKVGRSAGCLDVTDSIWAPLPA
ncbi:MAG: matrixin family metalloprotease [Actinomycetes bacterium]